jgi:ubiquinone/menaquinone biosynthesis C-methylase UbiE
LISVLSVFNLQIHVRTEFPWHDLPKGATICDVGGGIGYVSLELANAYPDLKIVLQDLPQTIEQARENFAKFCPKAIENETVQFKPLNFFLEAPVPDCDVYFVSQVADQLVTSKDDCLFYR